MCIIELPSDQLSEQNWFLSLSLPTVCSTLSHFHAHHATSAHWSMSLTCLVDEHSTVLDQQCTPGPWKSLRVLEFKRWKFKALKALENEEGPWKSLKMICCFWKMFIHWKCYWTFSPCYC